MFRLTLKRDETRMDKMNWIVLILWSGLKFAIGHHLVRFALVFRVIALRSRILCGHFGGMTPPI